jgi:hypothetical protein
LCVRRTLLARKVSKGVQELRDDEEEGIYREEK